MAKDPETLRELKSAMAVCVAAERLAELMASYGVMPNLSSDINQAHKELSRTLRAYLAGQE